MKVIRIATQPIPKPAEREGGAWMIRITQNGDNMVPPYFGVDPQTPWPTSLPAGTYGLVGQRLDTNNNSIGPQADGSYDWDGVGAETVEVAGSIGVIEV